MRKSLLAMAALLSVATASAGEVTIGNSLRNPNSRQFAMSHVGTRTETPSMDFQYYQTIYTAYSLNNISAGNVIYQCIEIPQDQVAAFKGSKITNMTIASSTNQNYVNPIRNVTLFISQDLKSAPVYTEDVTVSKTGFDMNNLTLSTPYEITDDTKPVYLGFYFKYTSAYSGSYYMVVDGISNVPGAAIYGVAQSEGSLPEGWATEGEEMGALCIGATISGDNLPENIVSISDAAGPVCVKPSDEFVFKALVKNCGVNQVENVEYKVECEGEETYTSSMTLTPALDKNSIDLYDFKMKPFTSLGSKTVKISITKVNGVEMAVPSVTEGLTECIATTYQRNALIEEFTGTGCGFCPAGIIMLDYLKDRYGERLPIVAIHNYGTDKLKCTDYSGWVNTYPQGAPYALLNRAYDATPSENKEALDPMIDFILSSDTYAKVEFDSFKMDEGADGNPNPSSKTAQFVVSAEFAIDTDKAYNVSVATVQNGMGPFAQSNYYTAGSKYGTLPPYKDWNPEKWGSTFQWTYDDVARTLSSFPGASLTTGSIVAGTKYTLPVNMKNMNRVTQAEGKFIAIVMLTDAETGEIVNVMQQEFNKNEAWTSGVGNIMMEDADVPAVIYNLNGMMMGSDINAVPAGIYIVKKGTKTQKVLVK